MNVQIRGRVHEFLCAFLGSYEEDNLYRDVGIPPLILDRCIEYVDEKESLRRTLCLIVNDMTAGTFHEISSRVAGIMYAEPVAELDIGLIYDFILHFAVRRSLICNLYINLCGEVREHMCNLSNSCSSLPVRADIEKESRKVIIESAIKLFVSCKYVPDEGIDDKARSNRKDKFIGMMIAMGELYNVGLIRGNVVKRCILDVYLPDKRVALTSAIEIEGICAFFRACKSKMLKKKNANYPQVWLDRLMDRSQGEFARIIELFLYYGYWE